MDSLALMVPTYYGASELADTESPDFSWPSVPVLAYSEAGLRIVLGTHDSSDMTKPDIQIERRPSGWANFLHPIGGGDPSGYVYFHDDGRSFVYREPWVDPPLVVMQGIDDRDEVDDVSRLSPDEVARIKRGDDGSEEGTEPDIIVE